MAALEAGVEARPESIVPCLAVYCPLSCCRQEEAHEWGSPAMAALEAGLDAPARSLVQAAHKWRTQVHAMKEVSRV